MSKINPFDFVNSINSSKKDLMRDTENDTLAEKSYNSWVVNLALSYFPDTVHYANMMNGNPHLDNRMQYCYLINTVRPKKRYNKWVSKQEDSDLEAVARYYGYNMKKARSAIQILSEEQLQQIKEFDKGR